MLHIWMGIASTHEAPKDARFLSPKSSENVLDSRTLFNKQDKTNLKNNKPKV